jgi:Fe-S-cluster containining protein
MHMPSNWFSGGVHFECTTCGKCCTVEPDLEKYTGVSVNYREREAIAQLLKITRKEFEAKYTKIVREVNGMAWRSLLFVLHEQLGFYACVFYNVETKKCGIYSARPTQCSSFPFWSTLLGSHEEWNSSAWGGVGAFACEGINNGPLITEDEIVRKLKSRAPKALDRDINSSG